MIGLFNRIYRVLLILNANWIDICFFFVMMKEWGGCSTCLIQANHTRLFSNGISCASSAAARSACCSVSSTPKIEQIYLRGISHSNLLLSPRRMEAIPYYHQTWPLADRTTGSSKGNGIRVDQVTKLMRRAKDSLLYQSSPSLSPSLREKIDWE